MGSMDRGNCIVKFLPPVRSSIFRFSRFLAVTRERKEIRWANNTANAPPRGSVASDCQKAMVNDAPGYDAIPDPSDPEHERIVRTDELVSWLVEEEKGEEEKREEWRRKISRKNGKNYLWAFQLSGTRRGKKN